MLRENKKTNVRIIAVLKTIPLSLFYGEESASSRRGEVPRALTHGATHFHAGSVRPGWARRYAETAEIGAHRFYRASVRQ